MTHSSAELPIETPVLRRPAHEHVAELLRRSIRAGTLAPEDRLPSEPQLARALGVSRSTLREALQCLRGEGYVESRRGAAGGLFVSDGAARRQGTREQIVRRRGELDQLMEFRAVVEPHAAALAARRRSAADIEGLEDALAAMRASTDVPSFRQADTAFHNTLASAAGNGFVARAVDDTREGLFGLVDLADFDILLSRSVPEHETVLQAVAAGAPDAAERAMAVHVASARAEMNEVIRAILTGTAYRAPE